MRQISFLNKLTQFIEALLRVFVEILRVQVIFSGRDRKQFVLRQTLIYTISKIGEIQI